MASMLPMARCGRLAELLAEADIATLNHLSQQGREKNTLRAPASGFGYLEACVRSGPARVLVPVIVLGVPSS